jgi:phosphatidate cytidylyltransferase
MDRNLLVRIASAAVLLPVLGALVWWREAWGFGLLALAAGTLALREYTALTLPGRPAGERCAVVAIGTSLTAAFYARPELGAVWSMMAVVLLGVLAVLRAGEDAARRLCASSFGVFYIGGMSAALPLLHQTAPDGRLWVIVALAVTFVGDTGAFFVGRAVGRHKLAPTISPGKTWEGFFGGLGAGMGFMFLARATFFPALTLRDVLLVGLVSSIVGPIGDLVESLIKRSAGAKDSGCLIPGHGGVLDRIDALLFVGAYVTLHVQLLR